MTGPVTTEALVEGKPTRRTLIQAQARRHYEHVCSLHEMIRSLEVALQQVTAERDEAREVVARCNNSFGSYSYHLNPHPAEQIEKVKWQARSEWQRAEAAEAALATATSELARLRAEGEADLEACAQHCEGYAALNADEATRRGKWLGEEKAARDEKCAALWATHHAANEMAGFIRDRIKSRTALARAATAREGA